MYTFIFTSIFLGRIPKGGSPTWQKRVRLLPHRLMRRSKENIMNLTYPPGMVLTEAMLTKELGMSRSPVRTAIQMLQVEGLIRF